MKIGAVVRAKGQETMDQKEMLEKLTREVAAKLPSELLEQLVGKVILEAIGRISWDAKEVATFVNAAVQEKARELLRTKYASDVAKKAEQLAGACVTQMGQMKIPESRY